jgi:DNA-binding GntR family transcriptional regulator
VNPDNHVPTRAVECLLVVDHDSPLPLHEQLATLLRDRIRSGVLKRRVPSILSLAQEHGVSHRTAARALTTLKDEGLIIPVRGKGFYVTGTPL